MENLSYENFYTELQERLKNNDYKVDIRVAGIETGAVKPKFLFSEEEYELLLDVWNELSRHSTAQLVTMTHAEGTPWDQVWNHSSSREITKESIGKFFSKIHLPSMKDALSAIPIVKPLYYKDGVPVFSAEENLQYE